MGPILKADPTPDRNRTLTTRAAEYGFLATGFSFAGSLVLRASEPLELVLVGIVLFGLTLGFVLFAALLTLTAYRESRRVSVLAVVLTLLPILVALVIAFAL